jgi:hypothetical protein
LKKILTGDRERLPTTWVLLQVWQDVVIIGCSSLSAAVSADGFLLGFSFYLVLLNHNWAAVPGRTSNEFHTCSNTCSSDCEKTIFFLKIGWYNFV